MENSQTQLFYCCVVFDCFPLSVNTVWCILTIKLTRCSNFSNLFLEWNSTCFGQFLCPSSGVLHCTHSNGICHTGLLCVQWKIPDGGQRNCPKHVEFHFKNKFEKLINLFSFIITNCTSIRKKQYMNSVLGGNGSPLWQTYLTYNWKKCVKNKEFLMSHLVAHLGTTRI
jgi:hypothetical protein